MQRSTNWAIKPTGSWSFSEFYIQLFRERLSNWKALKRTRQYRKAWWVVVVYCCIVKFTSFQRVGRRCYEYLFACVKRNKMDFELITCLLKFIEQFPDYLSVLSRMLLRSFWTTFVETAVYPLRWWDDNEYMKIHIFELRKKSWISERSSQLYTQLNFFFRFNFRNCLSCVYNCDDLSLIHYFFRSSNIWIFIYSLSRLM